MSTNVRIKKITTATNETAGRSNVYHDVFKGTVKEGDLLSSTMVGKLRKNRGSSDGYIAFAMNADGSRTEVGTFVTKSSAGHKARKAFVANGGVLPEGPKAIRAPRAAKATPAPVATTETDGEKAKREAKNLARRNKRAADKAAREAVAA